MINENETLADAKARSVDEKLARSREIFARAAKAAKPIPLTTATGGVSLAWLKEKIEFERQGRDS
jgi:hypothetical protein